mmetsp:Transcript_110165/g.312476  ORF Transcript_110165/g.312476 Transcript_110165/m.312476 type:complete len:205 (-) Transcript_110165:58-672(-)
MLQRWVRQCRTLDLPQFGAIPSQVGRPGTPRAPSRGAAASRMRCGVLGGGAAVGSRNGARAQQRRRTRRRSFAEEELASEGLDMESKGIGMQTFLDEALEPDPLAVGLDDATQVLLDHAVAALEGAGALGSGVEAQELVKSAPWMAESSGDHGRKTRGLRLEFDVCGDGGCGFAVCHAILKDDVLELHELILNGSPVRLDGDEG